MALVLLLEFMLISEHILKGYLFSPGISILVSDIRAYCLSFPAEYQAKT